MQEIIGTHDIVFITLDTLRYDVAQDMWRQGRTPFLASLLPASGWEARHTPGSFTYAAHQAFFAGFLPTPVEPGSHPRLFAARFPGSETTTLETSTFDAPDIVSELAARGYHTVCIGGVGFFNKASPPGFSFTGPLSRKSLEPRTGRDELLLHRKSGAAGLPDHRTYGRGTAPLPFHQRLGNPPAKLFLSAWSSA